MSVKTRPRYSRRKARTTNPYLTTGITAYPLRNRGGYFRLAFMSFTIDVVASANNLTVLKIIKIISPIGSPPFGGLAAKLAPCFYTESSITRFDKKSSVFLLFVILFMKRSCCFLAIPYSIW